MIKLLIVFVFMLLCGKNQDSYRSKTIEVNSLKLKAVSSIFKQTKHKLITSMCNISYRKTNEFF